MATNRLFQPSALREAVVVHTGVVGLGLAAWRSNAAAVPRHAPGEQRTDDTAGSTGPLDHDHAWRLITHDASTDATCVPLPDDLTDGETPLFGLVPPAAQQWPAPRNGRRRRFTVGITRKWCWCRI